MNWRSESGGRNGKQKIQAIIFESVEVHRKSSHVCGDDADVTWEVVGQENNDLTATGQGNPIIPKQGERNGRPSEYLLPA